MLILEIAQFTHSKNLDNMMEKLQQLYLISCENYLSPSKYATNPELSMIWIINGKVKNSTKL